MNQSECFVLKYCTSIVPTSARYTKLSMGEIGKRTKIHGMELNWIAFLSGMVDGTERDEIANLSHAYPEIKYSDWLSLVMRHPSDQSGCFFV